MPTASAPSPPAQVLSRRERLKRGAWIAAGTLALLWLVRVLFFSVYRVASGSMEPTLHGPYADAAGFELAGEVVLVRLRRGWKPSRFDLVVHERAEQPDPVVKRVAGLPGESIQVVDGDLVIDGARLGAEVSRPPWIPLFDAREQLVEQYFSFEQAPRGPWTRVGAAWRLDALATRLDSDAGLMFFHKDLRDAHRRPDGTFSEGAEQVGDGALELEFRVEQFASDWRLRLRHVEAGDTLQAIFSPGAGVGRAHVVLLRRNTSGPEGVSQLAEAELELAAQAWHRVRFANRDNQVLLDVDGVRVLRGTYASNADYAGIKPAGSHSVGPRAAYGGEGLVATFRGVRVLRDVHYLPRGEHAIGKPLTLGPDEYFLLGDDSAHSLDSRSFGPLRAAEIVGEPVAVLWPPSSWRWLCPSEP
jgi:signal peptidase I